MKFSNKKLSQTITQLCVAKGIRNIVISPGSRNAPLTIGFTENKNFKNCFAYLNNKYYLDLYDAARVVLKSLGVASISGGDRCSYKESDQYFSYRRDGEYSGRMAHLIWMGRP